MIHRVSQYNLYGKIQWISSVWMTTSCHRTHPNTRGRCHGRRGVSVREGRGTPAFPPALGAHRAVFACGRPALLKIILAHFTFFTRRGSVLILNEKKTKKKRIQNIRKKKKKRKERFSISTNKIINLTIVISLRAIFAHRNNGCTFFLAVFSSLAGNALLVQRNASVSTPSPSSALFTL